MPAQSVVQEQLIDCANELWKEFDRATALRAYFDSCNSMEIVQTIAASNYTETANLLRVAVLESWVMSLSRMTEHEGRDRQNFNLAASLVSKLDFSLLSTESARSLNSFLRLWESVDAHASRERIKHLRSHAIAHSIRHKLNKKQNPNLRDVQVIHAACARLIQHLGRGLNTTSISALAPKRVWDERVSRFWAAFK